MMWYQSKNMITDLMSVTANPTLPVGWRDLFCYTFKCQVCHAIPINPPVIIIKFCRNILRCEECVNTWYSGLDAMMKTCPVCHRSELIACEQTFSI